MSDAQAIHYQHRFVAEAGTASAMARAAVANTFRSRSWWLTSTSVAAVLALFFLTVTSARFSLLKLVTAALYGIVVVSMVSVLGAVIIYVRTVRPMRFIVYAGAELQSGFGEDAFVVEGPQGMGRKSYTMVRSVVVRGDFVFVRFRDNPLVVLYPRELFPDEAVARVQAEISDR